MPIYCYRCEGCGFDFEKLVRTSAEEPEACPKCRGKARKEFAPFPSAGVVPLRLRPEGLPVPAVALVPAVPAAPVIIIRTPKWKLRDSPRLPSSTIPEK